MSWKVEIKKNEPDEYQDEMERNRILAWLQTDVDDIINDLETLRDNLQDYRPGDKTSTSPTSAVVRLSKAIGELRADLQDWIR